MTTDMKLSWPATDKSAQNKVHLKKKKNATNEFMPSSSCYQKSDWQNYRITASKIFTKSRKTHTLLIVLHKFFQQISYRLRYFYVPREATTCLQIILIYMATKRKMKRSSKNPITPKAPSGKMSSGEIKYKNAARIRMQILNLNIHIRPPMLKNS